MGSADSRPAAPRPRPGAGFEQNKVEEYGQETGENGRRPAG